MSKFSKKFVSLASSLLAFTSLAGAAKAHVNPYDPKNEGIPETGSQFHTIMNAWNATKEDYESFIKYRKESSQTQDSIKDIPYRIVNRVSNNRGKVGAITTIVGALGLANKLGVFDNFLGENKNNENYDNNSDNNNENSPLNLNDYGKYE